MTDCVYELDSLRRADNCIQNYVVHSALYQVETGLTRSNVFINYKIHGCFITSNTLIYVCLEYGNIRKTMPNMFVL